MENCLFFRQEPSYLSFKKIAKEMPRIHIYNTKNHSSHRRVRGDPKLKSLLYLKEHSQLVIPTLKGSSRILSRRDRIVKYSMTKIWASQETIQKHKKIAPSEDRTHDLKIMRLTRCLLRYRVFWKLRKSGESKNQTRNVLEILNRKRNGIKNQPIWV